MFFTKACKDKIDAGTFCTMLVWEESDSAECYFVQCYFAQSLTPRSVSKFWIFFLNVPKYMEKNQHTDLGVVIF